MDVSDEQISQLEDEVKKLETEIIDLERKPSGLIGLIFIIPGIILLAISIFDLEKILPRIDYYVVDNTQILAFIGLGLVFWGALFFFIRPISFVKGEILNATTLPFYETIDRISDENNFNRIGYYLPPYMRGIRTPEHLEGLQTFFIYLSSQKDLPSIEDIASSQFSVKKTEGIIFNAPGSGLVDQFEKELRKSINKITLLNISNILPKIIKENLQLVKNISIDVEETHIYLEVIDSAFKELYINQDLKSVFYLGCPLVSAVACLIAITSGKIVVIKEITVESDADIIKASFHFQEDVK